MEKSDPGPGTRPRPPSEIKAMYAPAWFIDGEVTGRVIKSGTEVRVVEAMQAGYVSRLLRCQRRFIR